MNEPVLKKLKCPECQSHKLDWKSFVSENKKIQEGVVWCKECNAWFPIEEKILEFLPASLAYSDDRSLFWTKYDKQLEEIGLLPFGKNQMIGDFQEQKKQQDHFDWYAQNETQTYSSYEEMPFWKAVDDIAFNSWKTQIEKGKWLLDIGCAQGRSTFHFIDFPINIVGFDISKECVRQAMKRYESSNAKSDAVFFVGDASNIPFIEESFDYVLIYGVLHHLPQPSKVCSDVAHVLVQGGVYFGSENNKTVFRSIFDLLQKINPIWHEEAGEEPLLAEKDIHHWFGDTMKIKCKTQVFLPPHFINLFGKKLSLPLVQITDKIGQIIPGLKANGGLIVMTGIKINIKKSETNIDK